MRKVREVVAAARESGLTAGQQGQTDGHGCTSNIREGVDRFQQVTIKWGLRCEEWKPVKARHGCATVIDQRCRSAWSRARPAFARYNALERDA